MPQKPMPECPFCTIGSAYVVPYGSGYRCNHCLGVFDPNGEALDIHEDENDADVEWIDTHDDGSVYNGGRRSWPGFENVPW